jgi:ribosomal protein L24
VAVADHTLTVGDDVRVIAGAHQGHQATIVALAEPSGSRHTVHCEDGQTVRLSTVHVQRTSPAERVG